MGRNNRKNRPSVVPIDLVRDAQDALTVALRYDPKYSLEPDPTKSLGLDLAQKNFIKAYIEFRSIPTAAQMIDIDEDLARQYFFDENCRSEIRRITLAMYYRKFSRRLLSIDELGGYLTSMLIDADLGEAEKLTNQEKLQVARMVMDLNKLKADAYRNPQMIENVAFVENEVKDLSPEELRNLIQETKKPSKQTQEKQAEIDAVKDTLIDQINKDHYLDPSEIAFLKSCSVEELEKLLQGGEKNEKSETNPEET